MRSLDDNAKEIIGEIPKLARIVNRLADLYQREPRSILPNEGIGGTILAMYDRPGRTMKGFRVNVNTIFPYERGRQYAELRHCTGESAKCDFTDAEWDTFVADCDQPLRVDEQRKEEAR